MATTTRLDGWRFIWGAGGRVHALCSHCGLEGPPDDSPKGECKSLGAVRVAKAEGWKKGADGRYCHAACAMPPQGPLARGLDGCDSRMDPED